MAVRKHLVVDGGQILQRMIIPWDDVVHSIRSWAVAHVAHPVVPLEDLGPELRPVRGQT